MTELIEHLTVVLQEQLKRCVQQTLVLTHHENFRKFLTTLNLYSQISNTLHFFMKHMENKQEGQRDALQSDPVLTV